MYPPLHFPLSLSWSAYLDHVSTLCAEQTRVLLSLPLEPDPCALPLLQPQWLLGSPLPLSNADVMCVSAPPFFIAFSLCIPGPGVDAGDLEAEVPRARVLALPLGPGADAVAVRLALLPPAAVRPAVVEVEPPARHVQLGPGHACSWGEGEVGSSVGSGLLACLPRFM